MIKKSESSGERIYIRPGEYTLRRRAARRGRVEIEPGPDFVLLFALGGTLRLAAEGGKLNLNEDGVLLLAPGEAVSAAIVGQVELLVLTLAPAVVLDCAVRARLTRDDALITFRIGLVENDERLARVSRDMAEEFQEEAAGRDLVISSLVEQTLVHVLRRYANINRAAGLELSRAGLVDRRIRRAVELMHAQLERDLPLEELAAAAHLSPFHFSRLFKKLTGATPHAYLAALRAVRAQALLAETDLSITEVGSRVGYASSSHFSKAFRRATGLSPRSFRNALVHP